MKDDVNAIAINPNSLLHAYEVKERYAIQKCMPPVYREHESLQQARSPVQHHNQSPTHRLPQLIRAAD
jgi:hypothetical protein